MAAAGMIEDFLLIVTLGFLGSFGHCAGMCGPLTVAFALSQKSAVAPGWRQQFSFHLLLNLGRIVSYGLVGAGIGAIGSLLIAGGQLAGVDSLLRRGMAIFTGILLIGLGLSQIQPGKTATHPIAHPFLQGVWHDRLSSLMMNLSLAPRWWTPVGLGLVWGLIPCGFLYVAQIRAAETGSLGRGAATMLAFGLGTLPVMLGVGVSAGMLSRDRRSQLFRMGGWVTLAIGLLLLLRTGEMVDYTGYGALVCLILALIARPISRLWAFPLKYRRALGVGAFVLSLAHGLHMLSHTFNWNLQAIQFMLPSYQLGMAAGIGAIALLTPAALTSFDGMVKALGDRWRQLHLLAVPALVLGAVHTILSGSNFLGGLAATPTQKLWSLALAAITGGVLLLRSPTIWVWFSWQKWYAPPGQSKSDTTHSQ